MKNNKDRNSTPAQSGRYGADWWKNHIEVEEKYEWRRFERTKKARQRNKRETGLVRDYLKALPSNQTILDSPCGMGRFCELIAEHGHQPIGMDSNMGRIIDTHDRLDPPVPVAHANIMHLPLSDDSLNAVICFRLLHHLGPDLVKEVLTEIHRISEHALVTFYSKHTWKYYRKRLFGKFPNGIYYSTKWMRQVSEETGWKISPDQPALSFFESLHVLWLTK